MTIFAPPSPPGAPRERVPISPDLPRTPPKLTWELLEVPRLVSRTHRGLQGPHEIHKVDMLKTLEICVFDPLESQKKCSGPFFYVPRTHPRPSGIVALPLQVASGHPKKSPRALRDPSWTSQGPILASVQDFGFHTFTLNTYRQNTYFYQLWSDSRKMTSV